MLETLPAELREYVSLRNVEGVAALSPPAQQRLAEAIAAGLKRLPQAVERLKANPDTSISELLNPPAQLVVKSSSEPTQQTHKDLADLFPR